MMLGSSHSCPKLTVAPGEIILRHIIRDITEQCAQSGSSIPEPVAAFIVKVIIRNPAHNFDSSKLMCSTEVDRLIGESSKLILKSTSVAIETLKMQFYFATHHSSKEELIKEHNLAFRSRISPIMEEVIFSKARTRLELELLYQKLVLLVVAHSGLGSPTNAQVVRETTAALHSIFPPSELGHFIALTRQDKEAQVKELSHIAAGIRLFNHHRGKSGAIGKGAGIPDIPNMMTTALEASNRSMERSIESVLATADKFTEVMVTLLLGEEKLPDGDSRWKAVGHIRDGLAMARQLLVYFSMLAKDMKAWTEYLRAIYDRMERRLARLEKTVHSRRVVPTVQVYPQFIDLAETWKGFQDMSVYVTHVRSIMDVLYAYVDVLSEPSQLAKNLLGSSSTVLKTDTERLAEEALDKINKEGFKCEVKYPDGIRNLDKLHFECASYCPWAAATGDGVVMMTSSELGIQTWKGKHYLFSCLKGAEEFGCDPQKYISEVLESARRHPALFHLLGLDDQVFTVDEGWGSTRLYKEHSTMKADTGVQTILHPVVKEKNPTYTWNMWELRRRALQLANLRGCKTTSMQTDQSHIRRDSSCQTRNIRSTGTQSSQSTYTNVPKPSTFVFGLRGKASRRPPHIVDLTPAIDEEDVPPQ